MNRNFQVAKPPAPQNRDGVKTLLLDGLWGSVTRLRLMQRRLAAAGVRDVETFAYRASGFCCLEEEGRRLAEHVAGLERPVNLVGYSMGGLVVQAARLANPDLDIRRVAFINTPHRGSLLAHWLPGAAIRQMRPGSKFLEKLASLEWSVPTLAIWTPGDLMVVPASSAAWPRATLTARCRVPAHIWPLFCPRTHAQLAAFLLE
jgi:Predicted acetyltransferases and hydrolases with the alpha/beta hydrolase fold